MRGVITTRDVFLNCVTIIRLWGLGTCLRCVRAALGREPTTFLAVVLQHDAARTAPLGREPALP
jgi:hypothetical protein